MKSSEVSKRYAKALFAVSKESGSLDKINSQLGALKLLLADSGVKSFLGDPKISTENKKNALSLSLNGKGVLPEIVKFIELLVLKKRITQLPEIVEAYETIIDTEAGLTRGVVLSAKPLSKESVQSLEAKISGILKKKIVLTNKEDASLIGGVVANVGGWTFDDSLETHLANISHNLFKH